MRGCSNEFVFGAILCWPAEPNVFAAATYMIVTKAVPSPSVTAIFDLKVIPVISRAPGLRLRKMRATP